MKPSSEEMTKSDYFFIFSVLLSGAIYMAWFAVDW
jgi:hypothetical protein